MKNIFIHIIVLFYIFSYQPDVFAQQFKKIYPKIEFKKEDKFKKFMTQYVNKKKKAKALYDSSRDNLYRLNEKIVNLKINITQNKKRIQDFNSDLKFKFEQMKTRHENQRNYVQNKLFYQNNDINEKIKRQKERLADLRRK